MMPRILRWHMILFVLHHASITEVTSSFNCLRASITCSNSGTCGSDGLCTGCGSYEGYNCEHLTAENGVNDCVASTVCLNGATCYDGNNDGDVNLVDCLCLARYAGSTCSTDRYTATCTNTDMDISIMPYSTSSAVYVKDKKTTCDLSDSGGTWTKNSIAHSGDTTCGDAVVGSTPDTWTREFVVQDLSDVLSDADFVVTVVCTRDDAVGVVTTATLSVTSDLAQTAITVETGLVTLTTISPSDSSLTIGQIITLTFTGDSDLEEILLETVVADDNNAGSSLTIISSGCRVSGFMAMVETNAGHPASDTKVVEVQLRIFQFTSNPSLKFTFTFTTCLSGDTSGCNPVTCTTRRKRENDNVKQTENLSVIEVVFYSKEAYKKYKESISRFQCAGCRDIVLPVVMSGAALFIGVMAIALLVVFVKKRRNIQQTKENETKQKPAV